MNKTKFLAQLQQRISMLDDAEQKDILDEYAQHIDMKVEQGMTEAEAIEDFGPFDDLAAEILGAYHVKAAAAQAVDKPGLRNGINDAAAAAEKAADATRRGMRKVTGAASDGWKKLTAKTKALAGSRNETAASANGSAWSTCTEFPGDDEHPAADEFPDAADGFSSDPGASLSGSLTPRCPEDGFFASLLRTCKKILRICWKAIKTLARWAWNVAVVCAMALSVCLSLFLIFAFGFGIMLLIQGYPVLGVSIAAFGGACATVSATFLLKKLIVRKKNAEPNPVANGFDADRPDASPDGSRTGGLAGLDDPFATARFAPAQPASAPAPTIRMGGFCHE